ncbi:competence type IV pilus minor pilin ComGD [Virgibacillus byunsanensis]|uniref:Competence type IV pilus minor pilin ComGD n=1 Tax=Virgibacillus byunsanensis TaxID=570945 RepID=A0ABW3LM06_9BACI
MKHQNGFTLLEVIFVLGIWSIIILISAPLNVTIVEKQEEKQFLETFKFDVLYMQNRSLLTNGYIKLTFYEESYAIHEDRKRLIKRDIPSNWQVNKWNLPFLSFDHEGTIRQPGTFNIKTNLTNYLIVCPLGKGRCYIVEQ